MGFALKGNMNVSDQASKVDQARNRYREAQEELKESYDKDLSGIKENFETKTQKQAKNYSEHKDELEVQNRINNENYSNKTQEVISRSQEEFKTKLKDNVSKFEKENRQTKNELTDKLSSISDSYKKSFAENERYQNQVKKSMGERYSNANKSYQEDFNKQVASIDNRSKKQNIDNREFDRKERIDETKKHSEELESLRSSSGEQKFKEISRLRNDSENLRTTLERENLLLKDRQEERVGDLLKLKGQEGEDVQKNYAELQETIKKKNNDLQAKQNLDHKKESKNLEKKFNEDIRNIQSIANQKVKGGTQVDSLNDEIKNVKNSYENRLQATRNEMERTNLANREKEETNDQSYREQLKQMKTANRESLSKSESESNKSLKDTMTLNREKNNALEERFKVDHTLLKTEAEQKIARVTGQEQGKVKEQRVEFGRVVNSLNDKSMETINALKDEYSKDKSQYIEKTKKDLNQEKVALKSQLIRQNALKETLYEQKLADMEKQTTKIIENYENRISQITRKSDSEIESIKATEVERKFKDDQLNKSTINSILQQNETEIVQLRDRFERMIAKDRVLNDYRTNNLIQKYEDQIGKERSGHQKELSMRLNEAQTQFDRLYQSSEQDRENLRTQYEQRMENMKLAALAQENSKKV